MYKRKWTQPSIIWIRCGQRKQSENFEDHECMYQHQILQIVWPPHFASQHTLRFWLKHHLDDIQMPYLKKILNTTKQASIGQENVHIKKAKKKSLKTNQELKILKIIQVLSTVQFQIVQLPTASTLSTHERRWFPDERKDFNKRSENFEDHICVIHMKTFRCFSLLISLV